MPELPEVETYRRRLLPTLAHRRISRILHPDPTLSAVPPELENAGLCGLMRHGKWLFLKTRAEKGILLHLRMTGQLHTRSASCKEPTVQHLRWALQLDDGTFMQLADPRRFATVEYIPQAAFQQLVRERLGPDPVEQPALFSADFLAHGLRARKAPVKNALMDQRLVAGMGNIYASESLHRAGIHPLRRGTRLSTARAMRLHTAILHSFQAALRNLAPVREADIRWYGRPVEERAGTDPFLVYGRAGQPCRSCGHAAIRRIQQAGRSTYYCPRCQR